MLNRTNPIPRLITHALCWLCLAAFTPPAAAFVYWQHDPATPGDWFDAANWDNGVPNSSDDTYINNGGTAQIASPGAECDDLYLGYTADHSGALELGGETSSLESSNDQYVGRAGTGIFTQTGGTNTVGDELYLGRYSNSSGTYALSGAGELSAYREYVGYEGTGTFTQTGGTNMVHWVLYLGYKSDSSGTYALSGTGQLSAGSEYVGYSGTGTFTQYGGSNTATYLSIGDDGSYVLSGGTLHVSDSALVMGTLDFASGSGSVTMTGLVNLGEAGLSGAGSTTFTLNPNSLLIVPTGFNPETEFGTFINHGSHVHNLGSMLTIGATETIIGRSTITDHVDIQGSLHATTGQRIDLESGLQVSNNGSVDLGTGRLRVDDDFSGISDDGELSAGYEHVGNYGTGTFTQTGGTNTVGSYLCLGHDSGSSGTYELSGTGQLSADHERVGYYGTGTFTQTGGTNTVGGWLNISNNSGSSGTYELSGTGQLSANHEQVGSYGTGTFAQTGGTNTVSYSLRLGYNSGSSGTYELSGTGQLSAGWEYVGYCSGTGTFTQTGGTNTISSGLYLGHLSGSSGTYTISAGQLTTAYLYVGYDDGSGTLNITDTVASITVSSRLRFGWDGTLAAVPGSAIHMTGSAFENKSADADAMAGLANLTLIFEGGIEDIDPFEVAGEDMGAVREGFDGNFVLDTLQLGGEEGVGQVQLVDWGDNQPNWSGIEALYVKNLLLGDGSLLDLNGLNLYYRSFTDLGGTIELGGGNLVQVGSIPGDANHDDVVNDQDASILAAHWQQSGMVWKDGDFNGDGIVNDRDASILAAHWQQTWEGENAAAVPEPSAILLCIPLCLAGLLLGRRRAGRPG